jgi:hypothetical protein
MANQKTHRESYPEQYTHELIGQVVQTDEGEVFTVERVVQSSFGPLAIPHTGPDIAYSVSNVTPIGKECGVYLEGTTLYCPIKFLLRLLGKPLKIGKGRDMRDGPDGKVRVEWNDLFCSIGFANVYDYKMYGVTLLRNNVWSVCHTPLSHRYALIAELVKANMYNPNL